jgi:hypothetical protein
MELVNVTETEWEREKREGERTKRMETKRIAVICRRNRTYQSSNGTSFYNSWIDPVLL